MIFPASRPMSCARPDCERPCRQGHLFCLEDWRALPPELQKRVRETWAALCRARTGPQYVERLKAYREARAAAIAAVTEVA